MADGIGIRIILLCIYIPTGHHIYDALRKENPEGSYEIPGLRTG